MHTVLLRNNLMLVFFLCRYLRQLMSKSEKVRVSVDGSHAAVISKRCPDIKTVLFRLLESVRQVLL